MRPWISACVALLAACTGEIVVPTHRGPDPVDLGPRVLPQAPMRRLTGREFERTLSDILGFPVTAASVPIDGVVGGFDNNEAIQTVTGAHVLAYQQVAEAAAAEALSPARAATTVGCTPSAACLASFVDTYSRRAYRRPPTEAERQLLLRVAAAVEDAAERWASYSAVLETLFQQPQLLFRPEVGFSDPWEGHLKLTGYEVATRLSYTLWESTPDDALLDAAARGDLDTPEGIAAAAHRMLADDRAKQASTHFAGQWLKLVKLPTLSFNPQRFPHFSPQLLASAGLEAEALLAEYLQGEVPMTDLYRSDHTYVDAPLAQLYGLSAPGPGLMRVSTASTDRGGWFGTAAFLMVTSKRDRTSVVHRGLFVRDQLLCDAPPPPPPGVETGNVGEGTLSEHLKDSGCAGCHKNLDPIGYGLEGYDALGSPRTQYSDGTALPADGWIEGMDDNRFKGARALGDRLARAPQATQCATKRLFQWSMGRNLAAEDGRGITALDETFRSKGNVFKELIHALLVSDDFRYRKAAEP